MTMREKMIQAAETMCNNTPTGAFICPDGDWCATRTPEEFKAFIEQQGFEVLECERTKESTAVAITKDGYRFAWNGYCSKVEASKKRENHTLRKYMQQPDVTINGNVFINKELTKDYLYEKLEDAKKDCFSSEEKDGIDIAIKTILSALE